MSEGPEKSKIVIDEDWKAKVQAEKEAAQAAASTPASDAIWAKPMETAGAPDANNFPLPPPSLAFLCTTLATQAMIALGQLPNPITGKSEVRLKQAKHHIDTLGMLEEKTTGNRTAEETALFDDLLHQLRLAYVTLSNPTSAQS